MDYHVLGPLEVLDDGGETVDVGSRQQRALLALLLANANRVVSTDRILEELWADDPEGKENTLWVYISRLRAALDPNAKNRSKSDVLVTRDHGYSLAIDLNDIDAHRFESEVERGRSLVKDDPEAASDVLSRALQLWRGEPYEDFSYEEFVRREVARLDELHLVASEDRLDAEIRGGRHREVIGDLHVLATDHPLRERPVELLMIALYRSGRPADALRAFQRHKRALGDELGIEPSPGLCRIEEQVLMHDARLKPPGRAADLAQEATNPFKGLEAFSEPDAATFFGRDRLVSDLLRRLADGHRLLTLVGASGSGKSSAVRAGLIPAIRKGAIGTAEDWLVAQMVPGSRPFTELEAALLRSALDTPDSLSELLDDPETGLLRAGLRLLPDTTSRLFLVIDQFEELFTLVESEDERTRFIRNLEVALEEPHGRIVVVLALRADFYARPLEYGTFASLLGNSVVNVVPLTPSELEAAAEQPASQAGVQFEPVLLTQLLTEVAGQIGGLPLFQYTLTELFDRRAGSVLTSGAYEEMGGVRGAVTRRAEELFVKLSPDEQEACKQLFLRLVKIADDGAWTRRRVAASEIVSITADVVDLQVVLDTFGSHRLLTFDRDHVSGSPTVEVAHEALLHEWERLSGWIDEGREDVLRHARFLTALREWEAADKNPDYLLSGERLDDYQRWAETSSLHLTAPERSFLYASIARQEEQRIAEQQRSARETKLDRQARRRLRGLAVGGAVLAALVTGILIVALTGQPPRIVAVHGPTGDAGANDLVLAGAASAESQFELEIERREPLIDAATDLEELARTGADLIVVSSGSGLDFAVEQVAPEYPDVHFVALDPVALHIEAPNITEMHFRVEESAFLAGSAAALTTTTDKVAFIGGLQDFTRESARTGFEQGVAFEDSGVEVISTYLGPLENPLATWNTNPELAKDLAITMYESGVDVIFHNVGESSAGIIAAARELSTPERHLWVIGSDVDQYQTARSDQDREHILTSTIKHHDTAVVQAVESFLRGDLPAGDVPIGSDEDGVGLSRQGGHLGSLGIDGALKNREGELAFGHITLATHVETSPRWQLPADVVVLLELGPDECRVLDVSGAELDGERLRVPRGAVVRFDLVNNLDGVGGMAVRTAEHSIELAQLRAEAQNGIPTSFGPMLGITLAEARTSTSSAAVMTGSTFVPNCIDYENAGPGGDSIPAVIVSPSQ